MSSPTPTSPDSPSSTTIGTPSCTTAVPGRYGQVPIDACNSNWPFHPDFAANLAWAVLMGVTTGVHLLQAIIYKKKYCWVLLMGGTWEVMSFTLRAVGSRYQQQMTYSVLSTILLLLAPLWLNAFVYMTVSRLIYFVHVDRAVMRCRAVVLTKLFVWLDVLCFVVQGGGGSLLSSEDAKIADIGKNVYIGGISLQAAVIVAFGVLTVRFYRELPAKGRSDRPLKLTGWLIIVLLANLVLIMVRIIFRLVEFIPGANFDNPLLTNEIWVFCLDALPVLLGLVLLNVIHPGLVLRGPGSDFPCTSRAEKKAGKKARNEERARQIVENKVGRDP